MALSLEKVDHLLWLGRYMERSFTTLNFITFAYDAALDDAQGIWKDQLAQLGFDIENDDPIAFFNDCLFDGTRSNSIKHSLGAAYDNAVVLRDVLGSETIAYVQMAVNSLEQAEVSGSPLLDLVSIVDDIMAFKGCCDDYIDDQVAINILKCGFSIERLDLYSRLGYRLDQLPKELHKLASRINAIGVPYDRAAFKELVGLICRDDFPRGVTFAGLGEILALVSRVF